MGIGIHPLFEIHCILNNIFELFGGSWWITYSILKKLALLCFVFHMLLFRLELRKPNPRIPYIQDDLYDFIFGDYQYKIWLTKKVNRDILESPSGDWETDRLYFSPQGLLNK